VDSGKTLFKQGVGQGTAIQTSYSNFTRMRMKPKTKELFFIQELLLAPYNKLQSVYNS